ncbi:MAG: hypothetical protein AAF639_37720 [Chloroflexota bacterium]
MGILPFDNIIERNHGLRWVYFFACFLGSIFLCPQPAALAQGCLKDADFDCNIPYTVVASDTLRIEYTYTNTTNTNFQSITLVDQIPRGTTLVSPKIIFSEDSPSGQIALAHDALLSFTFDEDSRHLTLTKGRLAQQQSTSFVYTVTVPKDLAGTVINMANAEVHIERVSAGRPEAELHGKHGRVGEPEGVDVYRFDRRVYVVEALPDEGLPEPIESSSLPDVATDQLSTPFPLVTILQPGVVHPTEPATTYRFIIENRGTAPIPEIINVAVSLPSNTRYLNGGDYDQDANVVHFSDIFMLEPGQKRTLQLSVGIPSTATAGITIPTPTFQALYRSQNRWVNMAQRSFGQTRVEREETVVATYRNLLGESFNPHHHGYYFPNYGWTIDHADDLTGEDLFVFFGSRICDDERVTDFASCKVKLRTQDWITRQFLDMEAGHCEGMAMSSQRLFEGLSFEGKKIPNDFQEDAGIVFDLVQDKHIENYIASYHVRQYFPSIQRVAEESRTLSMTQIISTLVEGFNQTPSVGYTLGIYKPGADGKFLEGHSITPYAVERVRDAGIYRIVVHDNNYPTQKHYIVVDTAQNTWRYETIDPGYHGDSTIQTLELTPVGLRDERNGDTDADRDGQIDYFRCPTLVCGFNLSSVSGRQTVSPTLEIRFSGLAKLGITENMHGSVTGYDFGDDSYKNEIPKAKTIFQKTGASDDNPDDVPPIYNFPYEKDASYTIRVGGTTADQPTYGDLSVVGSTISVGVKDITLYPGKKFKVWISPAERMIKFQSPKDDVAPALSMTYRPHNSEVQPFDAQIEGLRLTQDEWVRIRFDEAEQILFFYTYKKSTHDIDNSQEDTKSMVSAVEHDLWFHMDFYGSDGRQAHETLYQRLPVGIAFAYIAYEGEGIPACIRYSFDEIVGNEDDSGCEVMSMYLPIIQKHDPRQ